MDKFACKKAKRSTEMWPVPVAPSAAVALNASDAAAAADAAPRTPKGKKRFDLGAAAAKRANQADSDGLAKAMAEWRPSKMVFLCCMFFVALCVTNSCAVRRCPAQIAVCVQS